VKALCDKFDLPYNTGSLARQVGSTWKKIFRLSLPGPRKPQRRELPPVPERHTRIA
jgi:linoleoyl-CoA desaturase